MLRTNVSTKLNPYFGALAWTSSIAVIVIGGLLKLEPSKYQNEMGRWLLATLQDYAWVVIPTLTIVAGVSQRLKQGVGSWGTWRVVNHLIAEYRKALISNKPTKEDPEHFHRITLFRHVRWRWWLCRWPWSGWMVPVARTGHTTMRGIPRFKASASRPDEAEGIAGQVWARNRVVPVSGLHEVSNDISDKDLKAYADWTFVTPEWVRTQKEPQARSFLGVPLEVNGEPWGSLVVDSRSPEPISTKSALSRNPRYETLTEVLSKLLQA